MSLFCFEFEHISQRDFSEFEPTPLIFHKKNLPQDPVEFSSLDKHNDESSVYVMKTSLS